MQDGIPTNPSLQAAIAAVHAQAPTAAATDWAQIVACTAVLGRVEPSPVVELNRAVAVAMRDGPSAGLVLMDAILARGDLEDYHLAQSVREEARASYERALRLALQEPERRFLERRLGELRRRVAFRSALFSFRADPTVAIYWVSNVYLGWLALS